MHIMGSRVEEIRAAGLRNWVRDRSGLYLAEDIGDLRTAQEDVLDWAFNQDEQYLLVNAPTGVGKTLINLVYGFGTATPITYAVHTIRLQEQVTRTLPSLPLLTGRNNHPCLVGRTTHGMDITAKYGVCTMQQSCSYRDGDTLDGQYVQCPYYKQLDHALYSEVGRVTNYAMYLALPPVRYINEDAGTTGTAVLLADEAHNVEKALARCAEVVITAPMIRAAGYAWPRNVDTAGVHQWRGWALGGLRRISRTDHRPLIMELHAAFRALAALEPEDYDDFVVSFNGVTMTATPLWGRKYTMSRMFARVEGEDRFTSGYRGTKVMFTSATLMGAEYIAEMLGLPEREWAYLDVDSPFNPEQRPVNYSPVVSMNHELMSTVEGREPMRSAMDSLISRYVAAGEPWGVIHAVSNRYRDAILTESRWRGIMTSSVEEHEAQVGLGKPSVLVSASITEGWDGADRLCRFALIPKIPFADLSDAWTRARRAVDARTYDHQALVSVVQGVGRGMRHRADYCDSWILDGAWSRLYRMHKNWLPKAFLDAYHHNVPMEV